MTSAENTINKRVPVVTCIDRPEIETLLTEPIEIIFVNAGDNVTAAPETGVKVLSGTVDWYNCAVMLTVDPIRVNDAVVLKYAVIEVIVPVRGTESARLSKVPEAPVKSIVPLLAILTPAAELPNPTRLTVPNNPPKTVVNEVGTPDANGIIAPPPPVAPVGP